MLTTATEITTAGIFAYPERFLSLPLFQNKVILRNNKVLREKDFTELTASSLTTVSELFKPGTTTLMQYDEFRMAANCQISFEKFIEKDFRCQTEKHISYILKLF